MASALEHDPGVSLSLRQYRVLQRLAERPHRTSELATSSGVSQPTASATITTLEARGLVHRDADPRDRRATLIRLSPDGETVVRRATDCVTSRLERVTAGVTAQQAAALQELQIVLTAGMDRVRAQSRGVAMGP